MKKDKKNVIFVPKLIRIFSFRDKAKGYFKPNLTVGDEINNGQEVFVVLTTVNNMIVKSNEIPITK